MPRFLIMKLQERLDPLKDSFMILKVCSSSVPVAHVSKFFSGFWPTGRLLCAPGFGYPKAACYIKPLQRCHPSPVSDQSIGGVRQADASLSMKN